LRGEGDEAEGYIIGTFVGILVTEVLRRVM